jgi:hypothetical protein
VVVLVATQLRVLLEALEVVAVVQMVALATTQVALQHQVKEMRVVLALLRAFTRLVEVVEHLLLVLTAQ